MERKLILLFVLSLIIFPLVLAGEKQYDPNQVIQVKPFKHLLIYGDKNTIVVLHPSSKYEVLLENYLREDVQIDSGDMILAINVKRKENAPSATINIFAPEITSVFCPMAQQLIANATLHTDSICIETTTPIGNLSIDARVLHLQVFGDTHFVVSGKSETAHIECYNSKKSSTMIHADSLVVRNMHLECGSGSVMTVNVLDSLWLSGFNCKLDILGRPIIRKNYLFDYELYMHDNN